MFLRMLVEETVWSFSIITRKDLYQRRVYGGHIGGQKRFSLNSPGRMPLERSRASKACLRENNCAPYVLHSTPYCYGLNCSLSKFMC